MIAELGLISLILAFLFASLLAFMPFYSCSKRQSLRIDVVPFCVIGQAFFVFLAFVCLALSFLQDDFTVVYVLANSSIHLPWFYKLCAVWGGHEGSMLLWVAILSAWMLMVTVFGRGLDETFRARVLVVLAWISLGFFLFLLMASNPFLRQFHLMETQGRDLNPLLQDPGFLFHPPMLYMGYVGFSVAFAFAVAALWSGRFDALWAKWVRPWTLAAWCCLTAGITLGSLWAYRELGWGGWWFWDPVENASFMPWLVGTGLVHSLAVAEKRQQFMAWTLLLAISAFSLSLIGTFLVRSGVLTSVHAFAVDPKRGLFILCFLAFVIGGSLLLFAFRAKTLSQQKTLSLWSKEAVLLLNNVFLFVAMLSVLLGTVYPLLIDGLNLGKLSVGAPYFNAVFVPLFIPLLILMGLGIHLRWGQDKVKVVLKYLSPIFWLSLLIPPFALYGLMGSIKVYPLIGVVLGIWIILSTIKLFIARCRQQHFSRLTAAFWGMVVAHVGVAVTVIGIAVSTSYGVEDDRRMGPGDVVELAGFHLYFMAEKPLKGPNFTGKEVDIKIVTPHGKVRHIFAQKRVYEVGRMAMTESAIDISPFRDLYVALGEPLDETAWSVRLYYKPLVRWIWMGGFMILAGGLLAMVDKRYFRRQESLKSSIVEICR